MVHPSRRNRLNAVEFVHDVPGEMEREAVNSDEESPEGSPTHEAMSPENASGELFMDVSEDDVDDIISSQPEDWPLFVSDESD